MVIEDWIDRDDRLPTKEDGDFTGCVIAVHENNGIYITHWSNVVNNKLYWLWIHTLPVPDRHDRERS